MKTEIEIKLQQLPCWKGEISFQPLSGGITNVNYLVSDSDDGEAQYVVRIGDDIPVHQVMRFNELAASQAAFAAGISPKVSYHEVGILVLEYIQSQTLTAEMVRAQPMLERILPLIKSCHQELPKHFRGAALIFWVFHVSEITPQLLKRAKVSTVLYCLSYLKRHSLWSSRRIRHRLCSDIMIYSPPTFSMMGLGYG